MLSLLDVFVSLGACGLSVRVEPDQRCTSSVFQNHLPAVVDLHRDYSVATMNPATIHLVVHFVATCQRTDPRLAQSVLSSANGLLLKRTHQQMQCKDMRLQGFNVMELTSL